MNNLYKTISKLPVDKTGHKHNQSLIICKKLIKYYLKFITTRVMCYFTFDGCCEHTFKVKRIFFFQFFVVSDNFLNPQYLFIF